jgi:chromosome segregation ATPase
LFRRNESAVASSAESITRISERLLILDNETLPRLRTLFTERTSECECAKDEYRAVESLIGKKSKGEETLQKLRTSVYQAETIEREIMDAHARMDQVYNELTNIDGFLATLTSRDMPIVVDGVETPFMEAVVKLIMTDLDTLASATGEEQKEGEQVKQVVNVKTGNLERVASKMNAVASEIILLEGKVQSKKDIISDITAQFNGDKGNATVAQVQAAELKRSLKELEEKEDELLSEIMVTEKEIKTFRLGTKQAHIAKNHVTYLNNCIDWLEKNIELLPAKGIDYANENVFCQALAKEADLYADKQSGGKLRMIIDENGLITLSNPKLKPKEKSTLADKEQEIFEKSITAALSVLILRLCTAQITPLLKV